MGGGAGLGLGLSIPDVAARRLGGNDPATDALLARMSVAPGEARIGAIDALVRALKKAGVWAKLDALYCLAAHDAQAARLNWVSSGFTLAAVNSPGFTPDRGYTGDGATSYLDSGFVDGTSGALRQDNAHRGIWCGTNVDNSGAFDCGTTRGAINARNGGNARLFANASTISNVALPAATSIGWTCFSRSSAADYLFAKDSTLSTITTASAALTGTSARVCSGSASSYSARRIQAAHWGTALTSGEMSAMRTALAAWMTAVGA